MQTKQAAEKITVTIPLNLKDQLVALKRKHNTSLSAIFKEALEAYIRQEEIERWEKGAEIAACDEEYLRFVHELGNDQGDIHDY